MALQRKLAAVVVCFWAGLASASEGVVEAVGEAMIKKGDVVAAKKEATADGLKKCIEQVVGIAVTSEFSMEQKETVKQNEAEFYSKVRDSLVKKSEGFIQKHEVLDEKRDGDVMKIKVRAHVFESKVRAEVKKLADLITAAGNPKLMLVVQEVYFEPDGDKRISDQSALAAYLEKELIARGFELRGARAARHMADGSMKKYESWMSDSGAISEMARDEGADILIAGRVEIHNKGKIEDAGGLAALKGQYRVEISSVIKGVNAATGEVFSSKPVPMSSIGINLERAVHRAFRGRGANLVKQTFDDMIADIKTSFRKTAEMGQSYVVALTGVTSFRKQARAFLASLNDIAGISSAKQKSFDDGRLVVDVVCKCSPNELQDRVFEAIEGHGSLGALDIQGVSGKRLTFKL